MTGPVTLSHAAGSTDVQLHRARQLQRPDRRQRANMWMERHIHYWLMLPAAIAIGAVLLYPMVFSLWISFFNWSSLLRSHASSAFATT